MHIRDVPTRTLQKALAATRKSVGVDSDAAKMIQAELDRRKQRSKRARGGRSKLLKAVKP